MASTSWNKNESSNLQNRGLLGAGWRPLNRDLDLSYLSHLICNDTWELTQKGFAFERLDPALLRKGRIDLMCEFSHKFV